MNGMISKPMVIGHRGAAGEAPENTMASFALALAQGAQGIELDVHVTRDGEMVVCHDETLDRTTTGAGLICGHDWSYIQSLDAGSWYGNSYKGERVPLLREVFDLCPPGFLINVEVKRSYEGRMERALLALLRGCHRWGDIVVSSFDHKVVQRLKAAEPRINAGLLYAANLIDHAGYAHQVGDMFSLHPHHECIEKEDVAAASAAGLAVYPYTVNEISEYAHMIQAGVTGIITDYPGRLRAYLQT
ncbi:glycerophosphodiester phosphodiesterase [Paenibacillus roseipurpureus]|uniref:Glycerophosphodiester phosphodiesterase n=1 Tax=Paenibacillus roseopurpureus TaxID=2918901 RepID=A0AA96LQ38_9BACL|nr:glycerophosphodiester phosphodiesterase [Paenibacillus sp. MBLB1832]WNR45915.1 glycerophosphodiester phosphodiesterase [Paenibacillus sp. MBLB1832]